MATVRKCPIIGTAQIAIYSLYSKTKNVDRFYLNKEELAHIAGKEFLSERMKQVRDVLFSAVLLVWLMSKSLN